MPYEVLKDLAYGTIGSGGALLWLKGTWQRLLGMFLLGVVIAYTFGPWISELMNVPKIPTIITLGLFSMAIVDKAFTTIEAIDLQSLILKIFDKFLGVFK